MKRWILGLTLVWTVVGMGTAGAQGSCDNDNTCDSGETCLSCPADCDPIPTFSASPSNAGVGQEIVFTPFGVDDAAPAWDLGNAVHLTGRPLSYAYPATGTYQVVLTGTDNFCGTTQDSNPMTITIVNDPPPPPPACNSNGACDGSETCSSCPGDCDPRPTFTVSKSTAAVGETLSFTPYGVDDAAPAWDLGNSVHLTGRPLSYAYPQAGSYQVVLTGTDNFCGTTQNSFAQTITITNDPPPPPPGCNGNGTCDGSETCSNCPADCDPRPTFTSSKTSATVGEQITFTPFGVDDAAPSWDLGNAVHLTGRPLVYSYPSAGTYAVVLTGTDNACATTQSSTPKTITVVEGDPPPPPPPNSCNGNGACDGSETCANCPQECDPRPTFSASRMSAVVGEEITFIPQGVDDASPAWDLGNGVHRNGRPLTYSYTAPGLYPVVLTGTDNLCGTTQDSMPRTITISAAETVCNLNGTCDGSENCANCPGDCDPNPSPSVSTQRALVGQTITFGVTGVADAAPSWDLGNAEHRPGNPLHYSYPSPGLYSVRVTGTDATCATTQTSDPITITVEAGTPTECDQDTFCEAANGETCSTCPSDCALEPQFTVSNALAEVGQPILFTADRSRMVTPPVPRWDLGDATHWEGESITYSYSAPGTYPVVLTASDASCLLTRLSVPRLITVMPPQNCEPGFEFSCCGNNACDAGESTSCPMDCDGDEQVLGDAARILTHTIPPEIQCGQTVTANVTVRNIGTSTWSRTGGYKLGATGDKDPLGLTTRWELGPSEFIGYLDPPTTFTITLRAPYASGMLATEWQMVKEDVAWFGDPLKVPVHVVPGPGCSDDPLTTPDVRINGVTGQPVEFFLKLDGNTYITGYNESSETIGRVKDLVLQADRSTRSTCVANELTGRAGLIDGRDVENNPGGDRVYVSNNYLAWLDVMETPRGEEGYPDAHRAWSRGGELAGLWSLRYGSQLDFINRGAPVAGCTTPAAHNELIPGSRPGAGYWWWDKYSPPTEHILSVEKDTSDPTKPEWWLFGHHYAAQTTHGRWERTPGKYGKWLDGLRFETGARLAGFQWDVKNGVCGPGDPQLTINPSCEINESKSIPSTVEYIFKPADVRVTWQFRLPDPGYKVHHVSTGFWTGYKRDMDRPLLPDGTYNACDPAGPGDNWPPDNPPVTFFVQTSNAGPRVLDDSLCNGVPIETCQSQFSQFHCNPQTGITNPSSGHWARIGEGADLRRSVQLTLDGNPGQGSGTTQEDPKYLVWESLVGFDESHDGMVGLNLGIGPYQRGQAPFYSGGHYRSEVVLTTEGSRTAPRAVLVAPAEAAVGSAVTLDASASSDPDGTITGFAWQLGDGSTGNTAVVPHTFTEPGAYPVRVTVTDDSGLIAQAEQLVRVGLPLNPPPTSAPGGPYSARVGEAVILDGTASTDDHGIVRYEWEIGDGANASEAVVAHTFEAPGTYSAILTVWDVEGRSSAAVAHVTVADDVNQPPAVVISGPRTCRAPCTVTLTASITDPENDPTTVSWEGCASGTGPTALCNVDATGWHTAVARVSDGHGQGGASFAVNGTPNTNPTVAIDTSSVCGAGCTVTFAAATADADGDQVALSWSGCASGPGSQVSCSRTGSGTLTATAAGDDGHGGSASSSATVTVYPTAFDVGPRSDCIGTGPYVCTSDSPNGCTRQGTQTRTVAEAGWSTDPAAAVATPASAEQCVQATQGYIATYASTYQAAWTCTAAGANGCYKDRLTYSPSSYSDQPPAAAIPPARIFTTGYVASWSVGSWSACTKACGGGWHYRTVSAATFSSAGPDAPRPAEGQACNTDPCLYTCYDYSLFETRNECLGSGWSYCVIRYKNRGDGSLLTCWAGTE